MILWDTNFVMHNNLISALSTGTLFIMFILYLFNIIEVFGQQGIPYGVAVVGDISCNKNGKQTISSIANSNPNLIIFLGDLSYDNNLSCFFDQTNVLENKGTSQVLITIGNHDIDSGDGNKETKKQIVMHYKIPSEGYYSKTFDYGRNKIIVVAMNFTGLEENSKNNNDKIVLESKQYNFVKNALENSTAKYKIVASHAPFVSKKCKGFEVFFKLLTCHDSLENWNKSLFNKYHNLFKNTGVNIVLSAHNHNYQRVVIDGINYVISGLGGKSQYKIMDKDNTHFGDDYGFLQLKFYSDSMVGKFISNNGSTNRDTFTVKIN